MCRSGIQCDSQITLQQLRRTPFRVRAASLARKVYLRQKLGVGGLRKHYGGKNKRKVCAGASQQPATLDSRKTRFQSTAARFYQFHMLLWFCDIWFTGQLSKTLPCGLTVLR